MNRTKARALVRLTTTVNPETGHLDRMLKMVISVPEGQRNGDEVLRTMLNGFEDTINLMGVSFCEYRNETGDVQTGQTVHVGGLQRPRPQPQPAPEEPELSLWGRIKQKFI